jgi:hypothetical protein
MNAENFNVEFLLGMAHSPVRNYVIPGLTSYLIGSPSKAGTMRLFTCTRDHQEGITPHSHRFNLMCWVLRGSVTNRLWTATRQTESGRDDYMVSHLLYQGDMGQYEKVEHRVRSFGYEDHTYQAGDCYSMQAHEIHSIHFWRGATVLFFEGPTITDTSVVLEPYVDNAVIPTLEVKPWMFKREQSEPASHD